MIKKIALLGISVLVLSAAIMGCGSSSTKSDAAPMEQGQEVAVKYSSAVGRGNRQLAVKEDSNKITTAVAGQEGSKYEETAGENSDRQNAGVSTNAVNISQKVIFTGQMDLETLEFDKTRNELCNYMSTIGAYQQSSSVKGGGIGYMGLKNAVYIFRVPKTKYDQSFIDLRKFGTVVFEQSSGEDVTDQYFDTEARLKSLKIQQDRLLELLKKAIKMEDILKLEKELQTTNYEIENLTGTLKKWDSLVEYSTLTVNINEVEKIKPLQSKENDGLLHRIASGFKNSASGLWNFIQDTIVALAAALPVLIPLGGIGYVIYRIIRRKYKKASRSSGNEGDLNISENAGGPKNNELIKGPSEE